MRQSFKAAVPQVVAVLCLGLIDVGSVVAQELSLQATIDRVAAVHPQLKIFDSRRTELLAEAELANLKPGLSINAEIENFAGEGAYGGVDLGEYTLTLSGVLERGLKRELRRAVAMRRLDALGIERAVAELDLLAEVNRRYLDFVESVANRPLFERARDRQHALVVMLRQRHRAGALPESIVLSAEAEAMRLEAEYQNSVRAIRYSWARLSLLWGEVDSAGAVPQPEGLPEIPPAVIALPEVLHKVRKIPDLEYFVSAQRIHEVQQRLIEAERHRDIEWQLGLRRLAADSATVMVAGVSVPLGQSERVDLRSAVERATQQTLIYESKQRLLELETVLIRLHGESLRNSEYLRVLDSEVLPRLQRGVDQGAAALAAGAMTYMELAHMQRELLDTQRFRLQSQINIYRNRVEMQRLTGEPWAESTQSHGDQP